MTEDVGYIYVSVDDENDLSIHAPESSVDEDDPLEMEEEGLTLWTLAKVLQGIRRA